MKGMSTIFKHTFMSKRLLSFALVMCLLIGAAMPKLLITRAAAGGTFTAVSAEARLSQNALDAFGTGLTSLIKGKTPKIFDNGTLVNISGMETVTDGNLSTNRRISAGFFNTGAKAESWFVYEFEKLSVVEKIAVCTRAYKETGVNVFSKYELYLSETEAGLFDVANLYYTYDPASWLATQTLTAAGDPIKAKFFGFKMYKSANAAASYLDFDDLGVYGTPLDLPPDPITVSTAADMTQEQFDALGVSLIGGLSPVIRDNTDAAVTPNRDETRTVINWTDGKIAAANSYMLNKSTAYKDGPHATVTYEMDFTATIDSVLLFAHPPGNAPYLPGQYEIYVSGSETTLFDAGNKVTGYDNTSAPTAVQKFTFNLGKPVGKFIGFKILKQTAGAPDDGSRFRELAVYGSLNAEEDWGYTLDKPADLTQVEFNALGDNLLSGLSPVVLDNAAKVVVLDADPSGTTANWTDNSLTSGYLLKKADAYKDGPAAYLRYDLGAGVQVDKLALVNDPAGITGVYQLYVSDEAETLFNAEKLAAAFDNTEDNGAIQVFTYGGRKPSGRYYGVKVLRQTVSAAQDGIRFLEIGVYGTRQASVYFPAAEAKTAFSQNDLEVLGTNLLTGEIPQIWDNENKRVEPEVAVSQGTGLWTDNQAATGYTVDKGYAFGSGSFSSAVYRLDTGYKLEKILVHPTLPKGFGKYELYLSNDPARLFAWQNQVAAFELTADGAAQIYSFASGTEGCVYFGFRAYGQEPGGISLQEIGVFGNAEEPPSLEPEPVDSINQQIVNGLGTNLIKGQSPVVRDNMGKTVETVPPEKTQTGDWLIDRWADGDVTTSFFLNKSTAYKTGPSAAFYYTLGELTQIDTILLAHHQNPLYSTGEYKVYVSDKLEDLFAGYNEVAFYNNKINTTTAQILHFNGEKPKGKFVGFQITAITADATKNDGIRFRELGVYGSPYVPENVNLLKNMPVEVYLTSGDNVRKRLEESELSVQTKKRLTNGITSGLGDDAFVIPTGGKRIDIVFNLCGNMTFEQIRLINSLDTSKYVGEYKIYTAMSVEDVWLEPSEVRHYILPATGGEQVNPFGFDPMQTARFIRFSILVPGDGEFCNLGELELLGLDNQVAKNGDMIVGLPNENVMAFYENLSTFELIELGEFPQKPDRYQAGNIIDNTPSTLLDFYGGKHGEQTMDLLFYLGGLKVVNELQYTGHPGAPEYNAREVRYYIGETEEEVFGANAVPVAVFKDPLGTQGQHSIEITPVIGRYLRVSVVEGCAPERVLGGTDMTVITDISAMGFSVSGYDDPRDETIVSTFTDPETGIRVDILKLDMGDVYSKARSMRLFFHPLTEVQKEFLTQMAMTTYGDGFTIEFYDEDGKRIESLGGRSLRVWIPLPSEEEDYYFGKLWPDEVAVMDAVMRNNALVYMDGDLRTLSYALVYYGEDEYRLIEIPNTGRNASAAALLFAVSVTAVLNIRRRKTKSGKKEIS
jgi:hypothetical protein